MVEKIVPATASLAEREERALRDLRKYYPDGEVVRLDKDHSSLGERLSKLYVEIGYESRADYLEALGFTAGRQPWIQKRFLRSWLIAMMACPSRKRWDFC